MTRQSHWFGFSLSCAIACLGIVISWQLQSPWLGIASVIVAVMLSLVYYLASATRPGIERGFEICVAPVRWLMTILVLAIVYFLILTPIGLWLRVIRQHDPLDRAGDIPREGGQPQSFWVQTQSSPAGDDFSRTY